jgi:excisionase family DNA binding protein
MASPATTVDSDRPSFPQDSLDPDRLLDAAEVAVLLNTTPRWVSDAGRDGRLPSIKLGRVRRFRRETILAHVEGLETT